MYTFNLILLAAGLLTLMSLVAGVMSARLGLSFLLVFLTAGMLVGVDGPGGVRFYDTQLTAWVGNAALAIILLEGGLSTRMSTFRAGQRPTLGVALTAAIVGAVAMHAMGVDWRFGLLLGAIVSSTDAAAVFSVLRHAGVQLDARVSSALEVESGLNDPMAVFLTLALIDTIRTNAGWPQALELLARQAGFGLLVGLASGWAMAWLLRVVHARAPSQGGLLALMLLSAGFVVFASASLLDGSGFLAVYLFGVRVRALADEASRGAAVALDGYAWAAQAGLFLLLGVLVSPHQMMEDAGSTLAVAITLIFVARPVAVALCLAPLRFAWREIVFVGWVGLRGAVPIVLALFPLMAQLPDSYRFFNVAFAVVLLSLTLQGTFLARIARLLGLGADPRPAPTAPVRLQGHLVIDGELPLADVCHFFQVPLPEKPSATLAEWLDGALIGEAEHVVWHGVAFEVLDRDGGHVGRVRVSLERRAE
jgi:cell volume regulation protein A